MAKRYSIIQGADTYTLTLPDGCKVDFKKIKQAPSLNSSPPPIPNSDWQVDERHRSTKEVSKTTDSEVNHPSHYTSGKIEVIDFIEDQKLGFHLGNAVKYISRAGKKGLALTDIKKAKWYLDRYISEVLEK